MIWNQNNVLCKKTLLLIEFKTNKRTGQYTKSCIKCLDSKNISQNKCKHGKQKAQCRECGGTSFCKHSIQKTTCRDPLCGGGGSFCTHNELRAYCRDSECKGGTAYCEHNIQRSKCRNP